VERMDKRKIKGGEGLFVTDGGLTHRMRVIV
jgi:hypothetical protein